MRQHDHTRITELAMDIAVHLNRKLKRIADDTLELHFAGSAPSLGAPRVEGETLVFPTGENQREVLLRFKAALIGVSNTLLQAIMREERAARKGPHPKNKTGLKTIDGIADDPRFEDAYMDSDGIWVNLARGYNFEGCSSLRGDTVESVMNDWARVEAGDPY